MKGKKRGQNAITQLFGVAELRFADTLRQCVSNIRSNIIGKPRMLSLLSCYNRLLCFVLLVTSLYS